MKRLFKDTVVYGSGELLFQLAAFIVFPVYAHLFTVEEFGVMALVTTFAGLAGLFMNPGMNHAVQRYYFDPEVSAVLRPRLVSTGLWVLCGWSVLFTAVVLGLLYPLSGVIEERYRLAWPLLLLSLLANIPLQAVQYIQDILRLHFSPRKFILLSSLKNIATVLLGLLLIVVFGLGLAGFFWGALIALTAAVPLGLWQVRKELVPRFDRALAGKILLFGYPFVFANLAYWIFGSMDRWLLSELSNNAEVGLYSIGFKFTTVIVFLISAFGQAWAPFALKLYAEDPGYKIIFSRIFTLLCAALCLAGSSVSLFGREVLALTTPPSYWPAADVLAVLSAGVVLSGTQQVTALGISLERKTSLFAAVSWMTALLNLALNWVLIPRWGALGSAVATFISYGVLSGTYLYLSQRVHPLQLETGRLLIGLTALASAVAVSLLLNRLPWGFGVFSAKVLFLCLLVGVMLVSGTVRVSDIRSILPARR